MDSEQLLIALALHAILLDPSKRDKPPEELAAEAVRWNNLIKQAMKDELANRLSKRRKPYTEDDSQ